MLNLFTQSKKIRAKIKQRWYNMDKEGRRTNKPFLTEKTIVAIRIRSAEYDRYHRFRRSDCREYCLSCV